MAENIFGNLTRKTIVDELLKLGILQGREGSKKKRLSRPPGVAKPTGPFTGGYGGGFGKGGYGQRGVGFIPSKAELARPRKPSYWPTWKGIMKKHKRDWRRRLANPQFKARRGPSRSFTARR